MFEIDTPVGVAGPPSRSSEPEVEPVKVLVSSLFCRWRSPHLGPCTSPLASKVVDGRAEEVLSVERSMVHKSLSSRWPQL